VTTVADRSAAAAAQVSAAVGGDADAWDLAGYLPDEEIRSLARSGLLCADVPAEFGGPGMSMAELGEHTAHTGALCSSLRSLMTSQGMVAWAVRKLGAPAQQERFLRELATGATAAVAFSEAGAGSDLSAMTTTVTPDGADVVVSGVKVWVTGSAYADHVLVIGRYGDGGAAVVVPAGAPGVTVTRVADPLGCRAAGHAQVRLDEVRLPADHLLGGAGMPLEWLVTSVLTYGRLSVAWGCVGMLRACLAAVSRHASTRRQFGKPLVEHQLVARHIAELHVAEQAATRMCEHAARLWDERSPEQVVAAVAAKHFAATQATRGAASAVQVLASSAAAGGHVVARAYRDAKLMEIIEGSSEISQLLLAGHAVTAWT
jgi:methoxymalonate biosynthesis protein